jgi:hypothetical protein
VGSRAPALSMVAESAGSLHPPVRRSTGPSAGGASRVPTFDAIRAVATVPRACPPRVTRSVVRRVWSFRQRSPTTSFRTTDRVTRSPGTAATSPACARPATEKRAGANGTHAAQRRRHLARTEGADHEAGGGTKILGGRPLPRPSRPSRA